MRKKEDIQKVWFTKILSVDDDILKGLTRKNSSRKCGLTTFRNLRNCEIICGSKKLSIKSKCLEHACFTLEKLQEHIDKLKDNSSLDSSDVSGQIAIYHATNEKSASSSESNPFGHVSSKLAALDMRSDKMICDGFFHCDMNKLKTMRRNKENKTAQSFEFFNLFNGMFGLENIHTIRAFHNDNYYYDFIPHNIFQFYEHHPFNSTVFMNIVKGVLKGYKFLQQNNISHGAIKVENIVIGINRGHALYPMISNFEKAEYNPERNEEIKAEENISIGNLLGEFCAFLPLDTTSDFCQRYLFMVYNMTNVDGSNFDAMTVSDALASPFFWSPQECLNFIVNFWNSSKSQQTIGEKNIYEPMNMISLLDSHASNVFTEPFTLKSRFADDCVKKCLEFQQKFRSRRRGSNSFERSSPCSTSSLTGNSDYDGLRLSDLVKLIRNCYVHEASRGYLKRNPAVGKNDEYILKFINDFPVLMITIYACACSNTNQNISTYIPRKKKYRTVVNFTPTRR